MCISFFNKVYMFLKQKNLTLCAPMLWVLAHENFFSSLLLLPINFVI